MNELNVKVGDKVLVKTIVSEYLATVVKITPTRRIKTDRTGNTQYDNYGQQMGGDMWRRTSISVPTEEDYKRLKNDTTIRKALDLMRNCTLANTNVEQAEQIISILKKGETE